MEEVRGEGRGEERGEVEYRGERRRRGQKINELAFVQQCKS